VTIGHLISRDSVDGMVTGKANNSHLVQYKQTQQEFIATNKKNCIKNKFQKNVTTFYTITFCYELVK